MGEVRVKVKITNTGDEIMARRGLLPASEIRAYEADAMVDTGAVSPVLPSFVVQKLGLVILRHINVELGDGSVVTVGVTEPIGMEIQGRVTTLEALTTGTEVLIGQTFLEMTDMHVDCLNQRLIPNPAHPDQPILKLK